MSQSIESRKINLKGLFGLEGIEGREKETKEKGHKYFVWEEDERKRGKRMRVTGFCFFLNEDKFINSQIGG